MKPKLKDSLLILDKEKEIQIGFTPGKAIRIKDDLDFTRRLIKLLDGKNSVKDISVKLSKSEKGITKIIRQLDGFGIIEDNSLYDDCVLSKSELMRYKRSLSFFSLFTKDKHKIQEKLKNSRILLIGLGGAGSQLVYSLLSLGVGQITAIDFDKIELHNLNRQILYQEEDVGQLKTEIAKKRAKQINHNCEFKIINDKIDSLDTARKHIKDVDMVICTADGPVYYIYKWINQACVERGIPWIPCGVIETRASVGPLIIPGKTFCYNCLVENRLSEYPDYLEDVKLINNNPEILSRHIQPSIIPLFGIISNYLALDVVNYLTGMNKPKLTDKILWFDSEKMTFKFQELYIKKNCALCFSKTSRIV